MGDCMAALVRAVIVISFILFYGCGDSSNIKSIDDNLQQAVLLAEAGKHEESLDEMEEALRKNENLYQLWFYKGWVESELGYYERAKQSLRRAIELGDIPEAYDIMGEVYSAQGKYLEAAESYLMFARLQEVREDFKDDSYFSGTQSRAYVNAVDSLMRAGELEEARKVLDEAVSRNPGSPDLAKLKERVVEKK